MINGWNRLHPRIGIAKLSQDFFSVSFEIALKTKIAPSVAPTQVS